MNHSEIIVSGKTTICDAMRTVDKNDIKILIVAANNKVVGTLTDGDIRRFLFKGGTLDDAVEKAANTSPKVAKNRRQAVELYNRLYYIAIPIVNEAGEITDIYAGEDSPEKPIKKIELPGVIYARGR